MAQEDYYTALGVARDVDERALKKAYRALAMRYHPDRNPDDAKAEARFKVISEAYNILSDPEKRQIYDRFGHEGLKGQGAGASDIFSQFEDLFGGLFGGGRRRQRKRGADLRYDMELSLEACLTGLERSIKIPRASPCETCDGSGAKPGTQPEVCRTCAGRGQVAVARGFMTMTTTCPRCQGAGKQITKPCKTCKGQGKTIEHETLLVKIPAGVGHGMKLRLTAKGDPPPQQGGQPGDLHVVLHVSPHDRFERQDAELVGEIKIDVSQACLGAAIDYATLDDTCSVKIKGGTQPGDVIRVPGHGMPYVDGTPGRGALHLQVRIKIPTTLNDAQRAALEAFQAASE